MNNPYVKAAPKKSPVSTREEILFAPEVYREEPAPARRAARAEELAQQEIARLRTELRGETRALRSAIASRPKKEEVASADLAAQLASLRTRSPSSSRRRRRRRRRTRSRWRSPPQGSRGRRRRRSREPRTRRRAATGSAQRSRRWSTRRPVRGSSRTRARSRSPSSVRPASARPPPPRSSRPAPSWRKKTVALVSCDAFRVGAIDQLGKYADLMNTRFHTAMSQDELLDILATK